VRLLFCTPLLAVVLALPSLAADADQLTLEQAIARAAEREAAFTRENLDPVNVRLLEQQTKLGAFDAKTIETRAELIRLLKKRDDLITEDGNVLALRKTYGKSKVTKTFTQWLEEAKPKAVARPKSESPALGEYDYSAIDRHVAATPKEAEKSIKALADYVKKGAKNDREKARGIAKWIVDHFAYDFDGVKSGKFVQNPDKVLTLRATECGGHSAFFEAVGKACGLTTITVFGHTRATRVDPLFARTAIRTPSGVAYTSHAWNAVKIERHWYLLDVTNQNGRAKRNGRVEAERDPNWSFFLLPPERLISTHFPKNEQHQFLKEPLKRKDHEQLPFFEPGSFEYAVKPISHPGPLAAARDELLMSFEVPKDLWIYPNFQDEKGALSTAGSVATYREGGVVRLRIRFAKAGTYGLLISARKRDAKGNNWTPVIRYRLDATAGKDDHALPEVFVHGLDKEAVPILPRVKSLKAGDKVPFLVYLPRATAVGVYCAKTKEFTELKGKDGFFAGVVKVSAGDVHVSAKHPGADKNYWSVIGYKAE
jgi:transglutaminase-like putative cysteine protease